MTTAEQIRVAYLTGDYTTDELAYDFETTQRKIVMILAAITDVRNSPSLLRARDLLMKNSITTLNNLPKEILKGKGLPTSRKTED